MGFISKSFSVRAVARSLRRKKGFAERAGNGHDANGGAQESHAAETLDKYICDNLYIPIIRDDRIPVKGFDITRLTEDEFNKLERALSQCGAHEYIKLGLIFKSLVPTADTERRFI
jgi:hypothetical protein